MKAIVLYATRYGSTRVAAERIAAALEYQVMASLPDETTESV